MTNLTEKIDELQIQMGNEHTALLAKLDTLNGNLANLSYLPMMYEDFLYYLGRWDNPIYSLLAFYNNNASHLSNIQQILSDWAVREVMDTPLRRAAWEDVAAMQETIGVKAPGAEFTLASLVRAIATASANNATATGILGAPAPGTILDLLALLPKTDPCGCGPASPVPFTCTDPYISTGSRVLPWSLIGGTNQLFAMFPDPPPTGITFGTIFGWGADPGELESADWSQWMVFVTSTEPTYSDGTDATIRWPTGEWRQMSGSGSRAFAVDARGSITVQLCRVADYATTPVPQGECIEFAADEVSNAKQAVTLNGYPQSYTVRATDNFYIYYAGVYGGGPFAAGTDWSFSEFASQPVTLQFGSSPSDPVVLVNVCNPDPV